MAIKPILFNTDMVRAILDGRKTVTRRVVKKSQFMLLHKKEPFELEKEGLRAPFDSMTDAEYLNSTYKPPYQPGDILYVRETWSEWTGGYVYRAWISPFPQAGCYPTTTWHPSIHMPKEAAHIWLKVMDVRVERLQEITTKQILREGANQDAINHYIKQMPEETEDFIEAAHKVWYQQIWNSTLKKSDLDRYGWDANPWVWVIEFERCEKPEEPLT